MKITRLAPEDPELIRLGMRSEHRVYGGCGGRVLCKSSGLGFDSRAWFKPKKPKKKYLSGYRKVFAEANGKPVAKGNVVHHIDGDRDNNDPSNLREMTSKAHAILHKKQQRMGAARPCDVE